MTRREVLAGLAAAGLVGASGRWAGADDPKPPDEMTLPELIKSLGSGMAQAPVQVTPLASGLSLLTGPGGNVVASVGPEIGRAHV